VTILNLKSKASESLNVLLRPWGRVSVPRELLYEWQLDPILQPVYNPTDLPKAAREYLVPDNPMLIDLKRRYLECDLDVTTPLCLKMLLLLEQ
jgi:hypothetical protein